MRGRSCRPTSSPRARAFARMRVKTRSRTPTRRPAPDPSTAKTADASMEASPPGERSRVSSGGRGPLIPLVSSTHSHLPGLDRTKATVDVGAAVPGTGPGEAARAFELRRGLPRRDDRLATLEARPTTDFLIRHVLPQAR